MAARKGQPILAYKGFDENLRCRNKQYEIGKTYRHRGEVKRCRSGFHACEYPLDIFGYYEPASSRFAVVELSGKTDREEDGDTKICASTIKIKGEIGIPGLVKAAVEYIKERATEGKETNTGNWSAATNTGDWSAATNTGDWSAATNTGNRSAATNTGYRSAATNTGNRSAATNTGNWSAATNTGDWSAATIENKEGEEGKNKHAVAIATGYQSKARASLGSAIVCVYRNDDMGLIHIKAAITGQNGIKPDTFYTLDENGEFIEAND